MFIKAPNKATAIWIEWNCECL